MTLRLALFGSPLTHSSSPLLHALLSQSVGCKAEYWVIESSQQSFADALAYAHSKGVQGANVTAPYKEEAYHLCIQHTPVARQMKSVNTLKWCPQGWIGHNTDGYGFIHSIQSPDFHLSSDQGDQKSQHDPLTQKRADSKTQKVGDSPNLGKTLLWGIGGASRGVYVGLWNAVHAGQVNLDELICVGRRPDALESWRDWVENMHSLVDQKDTQRKDKKSRFITQNRLQSDLPTLSQFPCIDTLILAIPPQTQAHYIQLTHSWQHLLECNGKVYDLNYGTRTRGSCLWAKSRGLEWSSGLKMLAFQGIASFSFWTDLPLNPTLIWTQFQKKRHLLSSLSHEELNDVFEHFQCKIKSFT